MIEIQQYQIAACPVLEVVSSELRDEPLPTVFFYHGWTNVKEQALIHGYELAKRGMRAILPEALYHGERCDALLTEAHFGDFLTIVETSVTEFPMLFDYFNQLGKMDIEKIGVSGLSMGGITTCCLLAKYPWIKSADCLMGSPNLTDFMTQICQSSIAAGLAVPENWQAQIQAVEDLDLAHHPERLAARPVHFWHGKADDTVPYHPTYAFYERECVTSEGSNLTFTTTNGGHKVPMAITYEMAEFFKRTLAN